MRAITDGYAKSGAPGILLRPARGFCRNAHTAEETTPKFLTGIVRVGEDRQEMRTNLGKRHPVTAASWFPGKTNGK
jgi:hypothetical protein